MKGSIRIGSFSGEGGSRPIGNNIFEWPLSKRNAEWLQSARSSRSRTNINTWRGLTYSNGERLMTRRSVNILTRDGVCPASVFTPANGTVPFAAVIFLMDGFGIRPVMWEMGQRLADAGYLVLLPDLYYRLGSYPPKIPSQLSANPKLREELIKNVTSLDRDRKIIDTAAFIEFLMASPDVKGTRFGITGYCMGGNYALTAAGAFPDRFAAIASFHGGNLASDLAESPHRFIKHISGRIYVAGAIEDASFPEEQKHRLEQALSEADVDHLIETYTGARHGFAVPDHPAFDQAAAERHWLALIKLFGETIAREA